MADISIEDFFGVGSTDEALWVLQELEEEIIKFGRKIRRRITRFSWIPKEEILSQVNKMATMLDNAFWIESMEDYAAAAAIYGEELAGSLYQVQESFGGLQIAIIQAVAPLVQALIPVIQTVISVLTSLANVIGQVLRGLFLGSESAKAFTQSLNSAASAGTKLKRTLAGFDQINRLNDNSIIGGGFSVSAVQGLTGQWQELAQWLTDLFEPLKQIDLTPAAESLERLKKALEPITKALFEALEWAWHNIFLPISQWAVEELLPTFLDTLAASLEALGKIIEELKPYFLWLWENYLKPLAQWKADEVIAYLEGITATMKEGAGVLTSFNNPINEIIRSGKLMMDTMAALAEETLGLAGMTQRVTTSFEAFLQKTILSRGHLSGTSSSVEVLLGLFAEMGTIFDVLGEKSSATWDAITGAWGNTWEFFKEKLTDPAAEGMKEMTNSMIGVVNGMLSSLNSGVNALGKVLNNMNFTVPDWIPLLGGKSFSFSLPTLSIPKIPLLAKGAVLPANKPFMAVVGDQKHGTNIEAPLTTIQEAVALVMEDYMHANIAGHEATVGVLRELLSAVLGIRIGDDMIAAAVNRYDQKMAVMTGGYL